MFRKATFSCLLMASMVVDARSVVAVSWDDGGPDKLWSTAANWQFQNDPANSAVTIGNHIDAQNDTTLIDQSYTIDSLKLEKGADIVLSADGGITSHSLKVEGLAIVSSFDNLTESVITLYKAPELTPTLLRPSFSAEELYIGHRGIVELDSSNGLAILEVTDGSLNVDAGVSGGITGNGLIRLRDNVGITSTVLMSNDSVITAGHINGTVLGTPPATTLQISATHTGARFDLDGTFNAGTLQVNGNATLDIDVRPGSILGTSDFDGTMNLATGSTIDFAHAWEFGNSSGSSNGVINVNTPSFVFVIGQDPNPGPAAKIVGASWAMKNGTINIDDSWDTLQLESQLSAYGGTINNSGKIIFDANASFQSGVDFNMIGGGAALVVNAGVNIATPDFNLDGVGQFKNTTTINAGGILNLGLGAGADEDFDHTINLNGGQLQVATVDNDWSLGINGKINAIAGNTSLISGETFDVHGDIDVEGNSTLLVSAPSRYSPAAKVFVEAGSVLDHANVSFDGGSYTGGGVLKKGNATILEDTTWNVATVDIDDGTTTINNGAKLVVNTDSIDDSLDGIDSNISVATAGVLEFNLSGGAPVVIDNAGSISYTGTGVTRTFLMGSDIAMNGMLTVHGDGRSAARLDIGGTVAITSTAFDTPLRLGGGTLANPNTLNGGTINGNNNGNGGGPNGPGILNAEDGKALHGFGTINVDVEFEGNSNLIAEGGVLTLNELLLDVGTLGTSGSAATLALNVPWNTNATDQVLLQGGILHGGATVTNDGVNGINGFGEVKSKLINNSRLGANGGTMIYSNLANDWDGANGAGQIIADNGNIELRGLSQAGFSGTVQVDSGRELFTNGFALQHLLGSQLNLTQGTYRSTHATYLQGTTTVNAGGESTLQMNDAASFWNGSTVNLLGDLRLDGPNFQLEDGVAFVGGGALINGVGSRLELFPNAAVDVLLENEGDLGISGPGSVGQTTGLDFQQAASGVWEIDLAGVLLTDFDSMDLAGTALLDGALDLSLAMGFVPELGHTFDILTTTGGVSGMFASISQPTAMPADLMFDVNYLGSIVQLEVVEADPFTADFDKDGDVDSDDLDKWENAFGGLGADSDMDGDSDGIDFLAWQQQFGSGVSKNALAPTAVPEPTSAMLAGLAFVFSVLASRRR